MIVLADSLMPYSTIYNPGICRHCDDKFWVSCSYESVGVFPTCAISVLNSDKNSFVFPKINSA